MSILYSFKFYYYQKLAFFFNKEVLSLTFHFRFYTFHIFPTRNPCVLINIAVIVFHFRFSIFHFPLLKKEPPTWMALCMLKDPFLSQLNQLHCFSFSTLHYFQDIRTIPPVIPQFDLLVTAFRFSFFHYPAL